MSLSDCQRAESFPNTARSVPLPTPKDALTNIRMEITKQPTTELSGT